MGTSAGFVGERSEVSGGNIARGQSGQWNEESRTGNILMVAHIFVDKRVLGGWQGGKTASD